MKRIFLTLLFIICLCSQAWGAGPYYVTQSGAGAKNGTSLENAWPVSTFNALIGATYAGDTFYFSGTFTTRITVNIYGTSGSEVTLDGYQAGDCDPLASVGQCSSSALLNNGMQWGSSAAYLIIQDFRVQSATSAAIYGYNGPDHIIFQRNEVYNSAGASFVMNMVDYLIVRQNRIENFARSNPVQENFNIVSVDHCLIQDNIIGNDHNDICTSCNLSAVHDSKYLLVEGNEFFGASTGAAWGPKEYYNNGSTPNEYHIFRFNKLYDNSFVGISYVGGKDGQNYMYTYGNLIYNTFSQPSDEGNGVRSGDNAKDNYWWSNIIIDNEGYGFLTSAHAGDENNLDGIHFYNNTLVRNGIDRPYVTRTGVLLLTGPGNQINIKNNIIVNNRPNGNSSWYNQVYDGFGATYDYNTYWHDSDPGTKLFWYYGGNFRTLAYMQGLSKETNSDITNPGFTNPAGADYTYGTEDDNYTLDGSNIDDGVDLSQCFSVNLSNGDAWFENKTGYGIVTVCLDDGLDPANTDWTTTPPAVATVKQDDYGSWERGAYVYTGVGPGPGQNHPPNGTITVNPTTTVDENDEITLEGSYTDTDGDTCTYVWVIEAETFKEWDAGTTYDAGDIVEDPDAGDSGDFYKSKAGSNLNHEPPNATYWDNAETQEDPGTGVCDTAGIYSIVLTVNDGTDDDLTSASVFITVNDPLDGASPTTEIWSKNTTGDHTGDYAYGDGTFIMHQYPTGASGSNANLLTHLTTGDWWYESLVDFNLTDINGETVTDAKLGLYLEINPPYHTVNVEVWSVTDAFVEATATWNTYNGSDTWTGTRGHLNFLAELEFTTSSSEGQFYEWSSQTLTTYVNSIAATGGVARFVFLEDSSGGGITWFSSDDDTDGQRPYLEISYGASDPASVPEITTITCLTADGDYNDGDSIGPFEVTFSEPVDVTGTPQLQIELGDNDATCNYASGSGGATLTFAAFTVSAASNHTSADLDANQLDLNGGSITSADDATDVADAEPDDILDVFPTGATTGSLAFNTDIEIDTTAATVASVMGENADYCSTCTADDTYTTAGTMIYWALKTDETNLGIYAEPGYPRIEMDVHPVNTIYASAMGLGSGNEDATGTVVFGFPLLAGMRTTDLNFTGDIDFGPGGAVHDPSSNTISDSMGILSLSDVAAIVIAVPYPSTSPYDLDATSTMAAWLTSSYLVPGDNFDFTADAADAFDASGSDGTAESLITLDGLGHTISGTHTYGDYYVIMRIIR